MVRRNKKNESIISTIFNGIKKDMFSIMEQRIRVLEGKVIDMALSYMLFLIGVLFLFVSLTFAMHYYFNLDYAQTFLCTGVLMILIAAILKYRAAKN